MSTAAAKVNDLVINVGIAEMAVSRDAQARIVTHALGSCIGVVVWDPVARVGGLLHFLLPSVRGARPGERPPEAFADTGIPRLFEAMYREGAQKERIIVRVAGGASMGPPPKDDLFEIGSRNYTAMRKVFWKNGVLIKAEDVGGAVSRTLALDVGTGKLTVRTPQEEREL
jgi:chemotaxis protein CheD